MDGLVGSCADNTHVCVRDGFPCYTTAGCASLSGGPGRAKAARADNGGGRMGEP